MAVKIMQWNAGGLLNKFIEFKNYVLNNDEPPSIICLQETFLKANKNLKLDGYNVIRKDRDGDYLTRGGLATLIRSNISYKIIESPPNIECQVIEIKCRSLKFTVINVYCSPRSEIVEGDFKKLFKYNNCIITGDFNAYNPLWSKHSNVNKKGEIIESCLEEFSYCLLNTGEGTHQKHLGGMSALDLTMVSSSLALKCTWTVENNTLSSDHCPTICKLNAFINVDNEKKPNWIINKANWNLFQTKVKECFDGYVVGSVEESTSDITNFIIKAATEAIPKTSNKIKQRHKPLPYWDDKLSRIIKIRNRARNKMNKTKLLTDVLNYKKLKGMAQKSIKNSAKTYWQNYCNTLDTNTKLGSVWRMSKKMIGDNNNFNIKTLINNNTVCDNNETKANLLAETFAQNSSDANFTEEFLRTKSELDSNITADFTTKLNINDGEINNSFTFVELDDAIKTLKSKSSPGDDEICNEMIKQLPEKCRYVLLNLFNKIWKEGELPQSWKHSIIIPIAKPNKDNSDPNSYRPISLTSCLCKLLEKLVNNRLIWYLETNTLLNNAQTGFRKSKSTLDQIMKLQDKINKFNNCRGFTVGVFLDFEKAYDMLWRNGLLYKLSNLGISGHMLNFVKNFINDRTFQVRVGNSKSKTFNLNNGTPQGSIISPTLFLIFINDLATNINGLDLSLFADDSAIYKSGKNLNHILKDVQAGLDEIDIWCDKWGLKISNSKSTGVIFTHKIKYEIKTPLKIKNNKLNMENKVKFLGLIFDQRLTWLEHFKYIKSKCSRRLNLMRSLTGTSWGASKTALLTIYRALIRPLLDYGAPALDSASIKTKSIFNTIQYNALKLCCCAMAGTALSSLQVDCGEPPLKFRRLQAQIKFGIKIKATENHPSLCISEDHWSNYYGKFNKENESFYNKTKQFFDEHKLSLDLIKPNPVPPWAQKKVNIDTKLSNKLNKSDPVKLQESFGRELIENYKDYIKVYTDGSKNVDGKVAAAYYVHNFNVSNSVRISDNLTVFTAELIAIKLAVKWITDNSDNDSVKNKPIVILSDSLSALVALETKTSKTRPNLINTLLSDLYNLNNEVVLAWIPSHVNLKGNDIADSLAKGALANSSVDVEIPFEHNELNDVINKYITDLWQTDWSNCKTGSFYRKIEPNVSNKIKYINNNRNTEIKITRLRLGQCRLNKYLNKIDRHPTGLCQTCQEEESIDHYLLHCLESNLNYKIKLLCKKFSVGYNVIDILRHPIILSDVVSSINRNL